MTDIPTSFSSGSFPAGSFLAGLPQADRDELLRDARHMRLPAGATLLFEGDLSDRVVVVLVGTVRVFVTAANGREVLLTLAGPGELLGEMSALDGQAHSASVNTVDVAEVALVRAGSFRALLQRNATLAFAVALRLTRELRNVMGQRVGLEAFDVPTRLAHRIVELAERLDRGAGPIELPVSQHELAEACGSSREAVSKALATFRARGWVRTDRRSVTVLDLDALRARAS